MYPFIEIFGNSIGTYALISVFATLLCAFIFTIGLKKRGIMMEYGVYFFLFVVGGVVVGSHLLYAITQYKYVPYLFKKVDFQIWIARVQYIFGGSVFYGGLLGGIASGCLGLKVLKQDARIYADLMAPIIPLFHGFARIGCFLAGCCYGIESKWGFVAEGNSIVPDVNGISRFPVQLLEATCNFILAGVLALALYYSRDSAPRGILLKVYLVVYGIIRFADEFLRGDLIRGFWGPLSTSQWISIFVFVGAMILLVKDVIDNKKIAKNDGFCLQK